MHRSIHIKASRQSKIRTCCLLVSAWLISGCANNMASHQTIDENGDFIEISQSEQLQFDSELMFQLLAGEFAGNNEDMESAVVHYQRAADLTEDSRVAARSTYVALYGGDYESALRAAHRWHELDPSDPEIPRIYATVYLKLRQPVKASEYIIAMLDEMDEEPQKQALIVKKLLHDDAETEDGLVALKTLTRQYPDNQHLFILMARYSAQLERYDEAIEALDRVITITPDILDVYIIKSRILSVLGRKQEAMDLVLKVIKDRPDDFDLRLSYARMLVEEGLYEEAREQYLILDEINPDNAEILLSLSLLYIDTKQLDDASRNLERLLVLGKKESMAHYYLGRIAHNRKDYKQAISHYLKVQSSEYAFEAKLRIAGLFAVLDRPDEAIEQLEFLATQQSEWTKRVRIYLAQGEILRGQKKFEEALEMYNRVLVQNPDDADLLYARAMVAEKVDRLDITESDLLKVLSVEPDNVHALNALGYTLADRTERLEEAYAYIKKAADLLPDDPAIMDSLGWVSYRLGRLQDALRWTSAAYARLVDPEIAAHYGEVLWMLDQREKAEEVWSSGLKINSKHPVLLETLKRLKPVE